MSALEAWVSEPAWVVLEWVPGLVQAVAVVVVVAVQLVVTRG